MAWYLVKKDGSLVTYGGNSPKPKGFFVTDNLSKARTKINEILDDRYGKNKENTSTGKNTKGSNN